MKLWPFKVIPGPANKPMIAVDYKVMYPCNACFLEPEAAGALFGVNLV